MGGISDRLGRAKGAALVYLALSASYLIFALVKSDGGLYGSALLFGLCAWSIPTIMAATAGDFVGPRLAPAGLGFVTLFFAAGQAVGPWIRRLPGGPDPILHRPFFIGRRGLADRRILGDGT